MVCPLLIFPFDFRKWISELFDCSDIQSLLHILSEQTVAPLQHLFLTTNWDYLLQREVLALGYTLLMGTEYVYPLRNLGCLKNDGS